MIDSQVNGITHSVMDMAHHVTSPPTLHNGTGVPASFNGSWIPVSVNATGIPREMQFTEDSLVSVLAYSIMFLIASVGNLTVFITLFRR